MSRILYRHKKPEIRAKLAYDEYCLHVPGPPFELLPFPQQRACIAAVLKIEAELEADDYQDEEEADAKIRRHAQADAYRPFGKGKTKGATS